MNQHLQHIQEFIENSDHLSEDDKTALLKSLKSADKDLTISEFKLERTNKVKRTTAILLEETIEELEQKRAVIEDSNKALSKSLEDLKAAQAQLVQAEKMASLGELTYRYLKPCLCYKMVSRKSEAIKKSTIKCVDPY